MLAYGQLSIRDREQLAAEISDTQLTISTISNIFPKFNANNSEVNQCKPHKNERALT